MKVSIATAVMFAVLAMASTTHAAEYKAVEKNIKKSSSQLTKGVSDAPDALKSSYTAAKDVTKAAEAFSSGNFFQKATAGVQATISVNKAVNKVQKVEKNLKEGTAGATKASRDLQGGYAALENKPRKLQKRDFGEANGVNGDTVDKAVDIPAPELRKRGFGFLSSLFTSSAAKATGNALLKVPGAGAVKAAGSSVLRKAGVIGEKAGSTTISTAGGSFKKVVEEGGEQALNKGVKETTEQVVDKGIKETTEQVVDKGVKETTEQVVDKGVKETTEQVVDKGVKETTEQVVDKGIKEGGEQVVGNGLKEGGEQVVEEVAKKTTKDKVLLVTAGLGVGGAAVLAGNAIVNPGAKPLPETLKDPQIIAFGAPAATDTLPVDPATVGPGAVGVAAPAA